MTVDATAATTTNSQIELTGGAALAHMVSLVHDGPMFGMGGFQLLPFYEACRQLGLSHHLINDERTGVFAADAYAKTSGRIGFVDATLGPGATNLVTGLVESLNAGSPLIAIVGDAHRDHAGKNMTQETDQIAMLRPAVKAVLRVETIGRIPELFRRAVALATSGRPGPVVIDVPEDISHEEHLFNADDLTVDPRYRHVPALRTRPAAADVAAAAQAIASSERPMILAGGGVHLSSAQDALTKFAEDFGVPVAHTLTGKGAIACTSPMNAGLFGRYDRIANNLIAESDLLLVVGCKLGEIATKRYTVPAPGKRIIHLELVAEEVGRTADPEIVLWGDARSGLEDLHATLLAEREILADRFSNWVSQVPERMDAWRTKVADRLHSTDSPINIARLITELNATLPARSVVVADGGFAAHWGGLLYDTKQQGRGFVADRGFASIGYGLPGAMGAALGDPEAAVVALTGDGGFNMSLGDLETAKRLGINCVIIVLNNAASGYIKSLQHLMYGPESYHASDLEELDYAAIAQSFGCHSLRIDDPAHITDGIREALAQPGPSVIDLIVTRDPAKMLPGVDSRTQKVRKGDRIA